ncbi:MAG: Flp pilus assembly complex ATPase component TadA [Candidatus Omnitrophica bacterium]|nr:Flp pilus assembly complex ATPase component TadA [Candidatus Omnitrophota bacterium]
MQDILIESKKITPAQLEQALARQKNSGENLSRILINSGFATQQDLMSVLSRGLNIPAIHLAKYHIEPEVATLIPEKVSRQYQVIPISLIGKRLTVAIADPMNIFAMDDLKMLTSYEIVPVIASEAEIDAILDDLYRRQAGAELEGMEEELELTALSKAEEVVDLSKLGEASDQAPIVKAVDAIVAEALKRRASDIHIEPQEHDVRIRYRVDGDLQEAFRIPKKHQNAMLARLKILSRMDITEWRLPQDGRFRVKYQRREVDFRVSVLPVAFGNKVVMRALDKNNLSVGLDALGFLPTSLKAFKEAAARPYGMILVTGPTGSGKSTTLYSVLNQLNTVDRNVVTIEDPVEYQVNGITQIQVSPDIGLTFAAGLRSLLRQNPDVIMIGEIRDGETADIAIKSSLTGHLLLSTIHTNDAPSSITRLVDMGVEPFLIASSLVLAAAQRLCRQLCKHCKTPIDVPASALQRLEAEVDPKVIWYGPKGCAQCRQTGYHGRFGILETMLVDSRIQEMIVDRAASDQIKTYAVSQGMKTLRHEGIEHAAGGRTSLEEVLRVTAEE